MANSIAIIVGDFNHEITHELKNGAVRKLHQLGFSENQLEVFHVPGAVEIPLTAQFLARSGKFEAIIALGAVIRGDTDHYDYVCQQVSYGCQRVMLDESVPVIFGVLTTDNEEQALARCGGECGHKGEEAADAAVQMAQLVSHLASYNKQASI